MSDEGATATAEVAPELKSLGDQIVKLTLLEARSLVDYLKDEYNIEPATGGGVMMAPPTEGGGGGAAPEPTEFDAVLTGFGDNKIAVIKVVRAETGLGLKEAKELVEGAPKPLKQGVSKEDAEKVKKAIEESGGTVEIKPVG